MQTKARSTLGAAILLSALALSPAKAVAQTVYAVTIGNLLVSVGSPGVSKATGTATYTPSNGTAGFNGRVGTINQSYPGRGNWYYGVTVRGGGSGIYHGTTSTAAAPFVAEGAQETRNYLAAVGDTNFGQVQSAEANFGYFGMLWGSVEAQNRVQLGKQSGELVGILTGADILAVAAATGVAGYDGSYYVNVSLLGGSTFNQVRFYGGDGATLEYSYTSLAVAPQSVGIPLSPTGGSGETPAEAPAPVLGGTPVGAATGVGALGLLGLSRRRRLVRST